MNKECLLDDFIVVLYAKITWKNVLILRILLHILSSSLELPRRGRLANDNDHRGRQSDGFFCRLLFSSGSGGGDRQTPTKIWEILSGVVVEISLRVLRKL